MKTNLSIANQSHRNRFADDTTSVVVAWSINDSARSEDPAESRSYVLPAIAGIGYGLAWIAGLLVWPSNLAIDSTGRQVVGLYSHHVTQAAVQYILVEGVAGVLLGTVLIYLLRALQRQSPETKMLLPALLALSAAALSVSQCVLGLILIRSSVAGDITGSGDLFALVNRLDGVKQLCLCASAIWLARRANGIFLTGCGWLRGP